MIERMISLTEYGMTLLRIVVVFIIRAETGPDLVIEGSS